MTSPKCFRCKHAKSRHKLYGCISCFLGRCPSFLVKRDAAPVDDEQAVIDAAIALQKAANGRGYSSSDVWAVVKAVRKLRGLS